MLARLTGWGQHIGRLRIVIGFALSLEHRSLMLLRLTDTYIVRLDCLSVEIVATIDARIGVTTTTVVVLSDLRFLHSSLTTITYEGDHGG